MKNRLTQNSNRLNPLLILTKSQMPMTYAILFQSKRAGSVIYIAII